MLLFHKPAEPVMLVMLTLASLLPAGATIGMCAIAGARLPWYGHAMLAGFGVAMSLLFFFLLLHDAILASAGLRVALGADGKSLTLRRLLSRRTLHASDIESVELCDWTYEVSPVRGPTVEMYLVRVFLKSRTGERIRVAGEIAETRSPWMGRDRTRMNALAQKLGEALAVPVRAVENEADGQQRKP